MFSEIVFFAVLVCAFYKEPIVASDFDQLYLKKFFDFLKSFSSIL